MRVATIVLPLLAATTAAEGYTSTGTTPLREEASKSNILIGAGATNPNYLNSSMFSDVLAKQFNSLSPENEMKWNQLNPAPGQYNWGPLDRLVKFAQDNDMAVKGHGLISACCNPDYLLNITDPTDFRAAMTEHFEAVMHRYNTTMDRWDVVTEALNSQGAGLNTENDFYKVLGDGFVGEAFRIARAAAPHAKLFINENQVELLPKKRESLYELVRKLVAEGVPIDGVALQMHVTLVPTEPGVITDMVNTFKALGLETTIAEMDVHLLNSTQPGPVLDAYYEQAHLQGINDTLLNSTHQGQIYAHVLDEALQAGVTDISFWGFTDKHLYSWIPGTKPLMFDEYYTPKAAFYATHNALVQNVNRMLSKCGKMLKRTPSDL